MEKKKQIWGILNVTPDSFSDGGLFLDSSAAIKQGLLMSAQGADVIDIGGVSTRPKSKTYGDGAPEISIDEERQRVLPVIEQLLSVNKNITISIDTTRAEVALDALQRGAKVVNDISSGSNHSLLRVAADFGAEIVLMHNRGQGQVESPHTLYKDLIPDVIQELNQSIESALRHGIEIQNIWIDPGIGFAKTSDQCVELIAKIKAFSSCGCRVLLGASRKSFMASAIPWPSGRVPDPQERLGATLATSIWAFLNNVDAVRVHDVGEAWQAKKTLEALQNYS